MADQAVADALTQLAAIQQQMQQVLTAQQAAPPAAAAVAPPAAVPAVVNNGRSPATNATLDYATVTHIKLFHKATEALPTPFSLSKPNIRVLMTELKERTQSYGWDTTVAVDVNANTVVDAAGNHVTDYRNMLNVHGTITVGQIQRNTNRYIDANGRETQNNYQIFKCLSATVDEATKTRMAMDTEQYMYGANNDVPCGISYLKILLSKAQVDTRATTNHIRNSLRSLDTYMVNVAKHNIVAFNDYVKEQILDLQAHGETTSDILVNVLIGYKACTDVEFKEYVRKQYDRYIDGEDLMHETLMTKAEQKYQARVQDSEWNQPTDEQKEIIAMRAELKQMSQSKRKTATKPGSRTPKQTDGKTKNKAFTGKWKWRAQAPKPGDPHTKKFEGAEWMYCKYHKMWAKHLSEDCRDKERLQDNSTETEEAEVQAALAELEEIDSDDETDSTSE